MNQIEEGIPFYFREFSLESNAHVEYQFIVNGEQINDPRNPRTVIPAFGSELAMPDFSLPSEINYSPDNPHGTLKEEWVTSDYGAKTDVKIYLPPDYHSTGIYPVVYILDGSWFIEYGYARNIFDNLIGEERIVPTIGVFITCVCTEKERDIWYNCNPDYLDFLDDLVDRIDSKYATNQSPYARIHYGASMGGLCPAYVGLERPATFKLIGIHSGSFWFGTDYEILEAYTNASEELDLQVWLSVGTYEESPYGDDFSMVTNTETMETICQNKSWVTETLYLPEGHSFGFWRHTFDEMLEFLVSAESYSPPQPITNSTVKTSMTSTTPTGKNGLPAINLGGILMSIWIIILLRRGRLRFRNNNIKKDHE